MLRKTFSRFLLVFTIVLESFAGFGITAQAGINDSTDPTIDFNYVTENNITSADQALIKEGLDGRTVTAVGSEYYYGNNNPYQWVQIYNGDYGPQGGEFRRAMESSAESDKYVVLMEDVETTPGKTEYYTINISSDKVLDLNGHSLTLWDFRNKTDGTYKFSQSKDPAHHKVVMFDITKGATLTIIDSSSYKADNGESVGTGSIVTGAYMINPYKYDIRYYTTRDIFNVSDGNLVIYGGTFKAGRQKDQLKSNFSWNGVKELVGAAVQFGTSVLEYNSGIDAAEAVEADLLKTFEEEDKKKDSENESTKADNSTTNPDSSTKKKDGSGAKEEEKKSTPTSEAGKDDASKGRNQTVDEKEKSKDSKKENEKNKEETAKYDRNTQLAKAEKDITSAILNKDKITKMVDDAFALGEGIVKLIGSDENSRITQSIMGTVANVGNNGTLVIYNGKFMGYGSTPNVRNGVIEVTKQSTKTTFDNEKYKGGQVYVYGGTFEGYTGANIFNMVKTNTNQTMIQYEKNDKGQTVGKEVELHYSETNNLQTLFFENQDKITKDSDVETLTPVSTANVMVRGGTFRNYYEVSNVAILRSDEYNGKENDEEGNEEQVHFHKFSGTPGSVNLGVESFGKDLIRDGRIQIVDKYGDGALVLMDKSVSDESGISHYRLFCGDTELRYKNYLEVYPNTAITNSTHSFKLQTYYGDKDQKLISDAWCTDDENIRNSAFSNDEKFFSFAYDSVAAPSYYVMPEFPGTDVKGSNLNTSKVWYYNEPVDANGQAVPNVGTVETWVEGSYSGFDTKVSFNNSEKNYIDSVVAGISKPYYGQAVMDGYRNNMKWYTYKIYRVDPLTREYISESKVYGVDEPLAEVVYGTDSTSLRCKLPLLQMEEQIKKLRPNWKGYQQGELYRIVFSVDEHLAYDFYNKKETGVYRSKMDVASAESSVLFRCYSIHEAINDKGDISVEEYTPLQWSDQKVGAGAMAGIDLVNGKAGRVDYAGSKIFDVYYQWWEVDENGKEIRLLAGTDNVYEGDLTDKNYHTYEFWNVEKDGHLYARTVKPGDTTDTSGINNLPKNKLDWNSDMIFAYTNEMTDVNRLKKYKDQNLSLRNNNADYSNHAECYIPADMVGSKIRVKAVVVNCKWDDTYDKKQTFYSHTMDVVGSIDQVEVKIDAPIVGKTPDYTPEFPAGAPYGEEQTPLWEILLYDGWNAMDPTEKFVAGMDYRVTLSVSCDAGEVLSQKAEGLINGEFCHSKKIGFAEDGNVKYSTMEMTKSFKCFAEDEKSRLVSISMEIDAPKAGQSPDYSVELPFGARYAIDIDEEYAIQWYEIKADGVYVLDPKQPYTFKEGTKVGVDIILVSHTKSAFDVLTDGNGQIQENYMDAFINGEEAAIYDVYGRDPESCLLFYREFTVAGAEKEETPETPGPTVEPTVVPTVEPSEEVKDVKKVFSDVHSDWYTAYVQYVYDNSLMTGIKGTTQFQPNANITKAQVAQVLYNMAGQPASTNPSVFMELTDVYAGEWYAKAVAWAYNTGVVTGDINAKKFFPNADVTREQLALMIYRYAKFRGYTVNQTSDFAGLANAHKVASWSLDGVKWAVGAGLISGIEKNGVKDLAPQGNASRAQVAAILQRFCQRYEK